jgi:sortase A
MSASRRALLLIALCAGSAGGSLLAERAWLTAKAFVAERLNRGAFRAHLTDGDVHRPWSWADTWPIAELEVPRLGVRRSVLEGASGASLAFGAGHVDGTAEPNGPGNCVLAGHRDSWLAFLEHLHVGDTLVLRTRGETRRYTVTSAEVVSMWHTEILDPSPDARLTLVTCYPFGALTRGPLRYVVTCRAPSLREARAPAGASACAGTGARRAACRRAPGSDPTSGRRPRAH